MAGNSKETTVGSDQVIKLNVGGESFSTLKGTLSSSLFFRDLFKGHEDG